MAANAIFSTQEIPAIVDGSCDLSVGGSCFQLVKPSCDEVSVAYESSNFGISDILPLLFEEASFTMEEKCSFQTAQGLNVCSISMLSEEDKNNPKCTSQLAHLSFVQLPYSPKKQMCLDPQLNCQNFISFQMENADDYSPCTMDINFEMENFEKTTSNNEAAGSIKKEGLLTGVLQRQASLKTCGKLVQLFTNHGSALLKLTSKEKSFNERIYDTPNNRWRKYKRGASFNSTKIFLFFSILSSLGTLILIYLTLRVRQAAEGFVNV